MNRATELFSKMHDSSDKLSEINVSQGGNVTQSSARDLEFIREMES